ncbi:MAG TPA: response regulator transcription factor [Myxococcaceae bacterium]|nr:response regulator transcription factor [Myxococcaceae bacterium]
MSPDGSLPRLGRVLLVSSDPLVRAGIAGLLAGSGTMVTVEPGAPADAVVWDTPSAPPPSLGPGAPPVLALVQGEQDARMALSRGAAGVVLRSADAATLQAALLAVARGLVVIEHGFGSLLPAPEARPAATAEAFTPREREVLALLARGLSNRDIAEALGISAHTAKFHVNSILQKLGVERRTEAVVRAARMGLVTL